MRPVQALRRIAVSVVMAIGAVVATAVPASAHTVSGQGATDYRSTLTSVTPATPGLTVAVVNLGSNLKLTWTGPTKLVVLGYQGEPYLRIGPDGVFRNRLSPATYLNVTRSYGAIPPYADAAAPPDWVRLSGGHTVTWHDHRIHWMGGPTPPPVAAAPGAFHHVVTWTVKMTDAGKPIVVAGSLDYVPGSSPWPWLAVVLVLAIVGVLVGASRHWARGLAALVAVLVAADMVHALGTGVFAAGSVGHKFAVTFTGSYYSVVAWVLGAVAIRLLLKRSIDGLFAAVFTALVIGLFGGLADVVSLARSQVPFEWGVRPAQVLVAVSIGVGAGVVIGSIIAFRINRPAPAVEPSDATGAAIASG